MTKEEAFVNELIGYIFAFPYDDYMTMECLCRKLHKYGLIERKDGEWTCDFVERADTPQTEKTCDNCGTPRDKCVYCIEEDGMWTPQTDCDTCRHYKLACELFSEVCKYEPTTQNSNLTFETDTPQTESTGSPIGDYRDGVGAWQTDCGWSKPNED